MCRMIVYIVHNRGVLTLRANSVPKNLTFPSTNSEDHDENNRSVAGDKTFSFSSVWLLCVLKTEVVKEPQPKDIHSGPV